MSQENSSNSIGTLLLTFLAGAAVGAVVAALTTPKTGRELRGDLQEFPGKARRKARDLAEDLLVALDGAKGPRGAEAGEIEREG